MGRLWVYVIAGYIFFAGALYFTFDKWQLSRKLLKEEATRTAALEGELTAIRERLDKAAAVRQTGEKFRVEVKRASKSDDWGMRPVPDSVRERLCATAHCAETANKVPASDDKPSK